MLGRVYEYFLSQFADTAGDGYADVPGSCKSAALDEVRKHGRVLTPGRYVGVDPGADEGEPFEDKMMRLVTALRKEQAEGGRFDAAMAENMKALGFGDKPGGVP